MTFNSKLLPVDFHRIFQTITDRSIKLSQRVSYLLLIIVVLFFIDNTLSFSYYYNVNQKINNLNEINKLLEKINFSTDETNELKKLRTQILQHVTVKDRVYNCLTDFNFESDTENKNEPNNSKRNNLIHFITSSLGIILFLLLIFINAFKDAINKKETWLITITGSLFLIALSSVFMFGLSKVFSFIPLIRDTPTLNYVLNGILSVAIVVFTIYIFDDDEEDN